MGGGFFGGLSFVGEIASFRERGHDYGGWVRSLQRDGMLDESLAWTDEYRQWLAGLADSE